LLSKTRYQKLVLFNLVYERDYLVTLFLLLFDVLSKRDEKNILLYEAQKLTINLKLYEHIFQDHVIVFVKKCKDFIHTNKKSYIYKKNISLIFLEFHIIVFY